MNLDFEFLLRITVITLLYLIVLSIFLMSQHCYASCIDGIWYIWSLTFHGEPLCGFILDTPIYAGLSLKADLHWNFCPSPYSWLLMPYTCLFFFSSFFYFLFPCSLSQNFNHFISRYLKPLKGQQRLDKNDNQTCTTGSWSDGVKCAALVKEI